MSNPQTALAPTGVRLAGEKYMYVRALADPPNPRRPQAQADRCMRCQVEAGHHHLHLRGGHDRR